MDILGTLANYTYLHQALEYGDSINSASVTALHVDRDGDL